MTTSVDRRDPLVGRPGDPELAGLREAFLRARVRDTTVRLSLAMFRARGYAEVWGGDDDARRWAQTATELRTELDGLHRQLVDDGADGSVEAPEGPRNRLA
ncbi:MAG: hypothetical protein B7X41_12810 [Microbacterium sp. 14-71-5]|nr:MAG: hypothetical protein B7X41_12810 [Microbacterium sp. 14-71-5]